MRVVLALFLTLIASPALAQSYLIEPTLAKCQADSAAQCQKLACDALRQALDGKSWVDVHSDRAA